MAYITKRALLASGLAAAASAAKAQDLPGAPFATRHSGVFNGRRIDYVASLAETLVPADGSSPSARFVTTAYVARGSSSRRPVLFAFNGGPSSASLYLHMMALGPRRIAVPQDPSAPIGDLPLVDNPATVLDVADLVFIDPVETGFSRILPGGRRESFYSVEGDARSVSDLVLAWLKANGREASPKYVLGESYGTMRAALMAGQLSTTAPLDGVFLFGQAVNMIETSQRSKNVLAYATNLPALAAIAAYHGRAETGGKSLGAFIDESYAFGMGEYLQALVQGYDLHMAERQRIAARLEAFSGIPATYYLANDLVITKIAFARELLKDQGLILGTYDARYVGAAPPPGGRPVDPFGKVVEAVRPAMLSHLAGALKVPWPAETYRTSAPETQGWNWNGTLGPGGPFLDYDYAARIGPAFAANPNFRLMIGTGVFDLTTTVGPARYLVTKSDWPRDRVIQRQYLGGHMAYTHEPSLRLFTDDIRAFVTGRPLADGGNA